MQYHEGQPEYCSSYLAQRWQMRVDQMFLFEMLEQLDRRAPPNADDAAQAPWRPTRSCQSSTKVRVHVGICAPRRTSWTGSCDAPGASGVPHEWRLRCDHISIFSTLLLVLSQKLQNSITFYLLLISNHFTCSKLRNAYNTKFFH